MATATYYFNSITNDGSFDNASGYEYTKIADANIATFGRDNNNGHYVTLTGNQCDGTSLGIISQVTVAVLWANNNTLANIRFKMTPRFGGANVGDDHEPDDDVGAEGSQAWSDEFDITNDTNAPSPWTWTDIQNLDIRLTTVRGTTGRWSPYEARITVTYSNAEVTPDSCSQSHGASSPMLLGVVSLAAVACLNLTAVDSPTLTEILNLKSQQAAHTMVVDSPILQEIGGQSIQPDDAYHELSSSDVYFPRRNHGDPHILRPVTKHTPFLPRSFYGPVTNDLTVNPGGHSQTSESPVLTEKKSIASDSCAHSQASAEPSFEFKHILSINSASHGLSSESPFPIEIKSVTPDKTAHGQTTESPALTEKLILSVDSSSHSESASEPSLSHIYIPVISNTGHALISELPLLTEIKSVEGANSSHLHSSISPDVTEFRSIAGIDSSHLQSATESTFSHLYNLVPDSAYHILYSYSTFSDDVITNGGMEIGDPPSNWGIGNEPTVAERSGEKKHNGDFSYHLVFHGVGNNQDITQLTGGNSKYTFKVHAWYYLVYGEFTWYWRNGIGYDTSTKTGQWNEIVFLANEDDTPQITFSHIIAVPTEVYIDDVSAYNLLPVVLTEKKSIAPDSASQTQASESPTLTESLVLAADSTNHAISTVEPSFTHGYIFSGDSSNHALASESSIITEIKSLSPNGCNHVQTSGSPEFTLLEALTADSCTQNQTATEPSFGHLYNLTPSDSTLTQSSSSSSIGSVISQGFIRSILRPASKYYPYFMPIPLAGEGVTGELTPINALHYHSSTSPELTFGTLTVLVDSATHSQTSESPTLQLTTDIDVDSTSQGQSSDSPTFTVGATIQGDSCSHVQTASSPSFTHLYQLSPDSSTHGQSATTWVTSVTITQGFIRVPFKPCTEMTPWIHPIPLAGEGITGTISPSSGYHYHSATSPDLTFPLYTVLTDDATHSQVCESPTTIEIKSITPLQCSHFQTAQDLTLTETFSIIPDNTTHNIDCGSSELFNVFIPVINNSSHSQSCDSPSLEVKSIIIPEQSSNHAQICGSPDLTHIYLISPESASHSQSCQEDWLEPIYYPYPESCTNAQTATEPFLQQTYELSVENSSHVQTSGSVDLINTENIYPNSCYQWQSVNERIINSHMEYDASWSDYGTPATNEQSATRKTDGLYSRHVKDELADDTAGIYQVISKTAGRHYGFTFHYYLVDSMYEDTLRVTVADGTGTDYLHNATYTDINIWKVITVSDLEETDTGASEIVFRNNSDSLDIEFNIDRVSLWEHVVLTHTYNLGVNDASHTQEAYFTVAPETPEFITQNFQPYSSSHSQSATEATLAEKYSILPSDASHAQECDSFGWGFEGKQTVNPDSSSHAQFAEIPQIQETYIFAPDSTSHAQSCDSPTVSEVAGVTIAGADCTHSQIAETSGIVEIKSISPDNSSHSQTAGITSFEIAGTLYGDACSHSQTATEPEIQLTVSLSPDSTVHGHYCSTSELQETLSVAPDNAVHSQTTKDPTLLSTEILSVLSCTHSQTVTSPEFSHLYNLIVDSADHSQASTSPSFAESGTIQGDNCVHTQTSTEPVLTETKDVSPSDCSHSQTVSESSVAESLVNLVAADTNHSQQTSLPDVIQVYSVEPEDTTHSQDATISFFGEVWPDDTSHSIVSTEPTFGISITLAPDDCVHAQTASESSLVAAPHIAKWHFHAKAKQYHYIIATPKYFFMSRPTGHYEYADHAFIIPDVCNQTQTSEDVLLNNTVFLAPANCSHEI